MKLEEQLTSLELSKRLKELGVKQDSAFYWINDKKNATEEISTLRNIKIPAFAHNHLFHYSAFSVAELGEILKNHTKTLRRDIVNLTIEWDRNKWRICCNSANNYKFSSSKKLADATAKMLIQLIENKLIKL